VEHKLFFYPKKCEFHQRQIEYLRLVILEKKVAMDPMKVTRVCDWPTPENWTDVQAFIDFVNFYYCFIQDFLTIARPLFDLTRSDKTWNWDTKEQEAFECLKIAVMGIKRFDHKTKMKARSERQNLQTTSQLCTKQVGTREINQIIESLLKVNVQRITKTYQIET